MDTENERDNMRAVNNTRRPIFRGLVAIGIENAVADIRMISIFNIIYNYKSRTYSLNFKGLCAPYTSLYMLFINRYIDIDKFILHLQNVSIRLLLQIRSDDCLKSDI
jgi:hypothetical protein